MRLGDFDCGCDNRKYIMFQAGKFGLVEAGILAAACGLVLLSLKVKVPNA